MSRNYLNISLEKRTRNNMEGLLTKNDCRERQLAIMDEVSRICEENSIHYSLAYGSLIGAVRHKGFIPWDDDVDILLLRSDYEKLKTVLKNQKDTPWMVVLEESSSKNVFPFMKVVDDRTMVKAEDNIASHGIWIDVFPIDFLPGSPLKRKIFLFSCLIKRALVLSSITDFSSRKLGKKGFVKLALYMFVKVIGQKRIVASYNKEVRRYITSNSDYVGCLSSAYIEKECFPRHVFEETILMEFEGRMYSCLKHYDEYLSHLYGDYMKLPPEDKRKTHEIIAWSVE